MWWVNGWFLFCVQKCGYFMIVTPWNHWFLFCIMYVWLHVQDVSYCVVYIVFKCHKSTSSEKCSSLSYKYVNFCTFFPVMSCKGFHSKLVMCSCKIVASYVGNVFVNPNLAFLHDGPTKCLGICWHPTQNTDLSCVLVCDGWKEC